MQETDREIREQQKLKSPEEYVRYLDLLLPATKFNNRHVKNAIDRASQGLEDITNRIMDDSLFFTKKQSWWARWKDRRLEKKMQKEESRQHADKTRQDELQQAQKELQQKLQEYEHRMNSVQQLLESKGVDLSLLLASPNDSEAKEPEVVEDNEGSGENEEKTPDEDGEADFLKF